jgi:YbbR domain-containing protein
MRFNPLHNILLKVSAVALALLLWVHVATNKTYEYQLILPLRIDHIPPGLVMVSELPTEVEIKVRATGKQLLVMTTESSTIVIDAAGFKAGSTERSVTNAEVRAALDRPPEGVEVIFPRTFFLKLEKASQKKLPVRSMINIQPAAGFALVSSPLIDPDTVLVSGPASVVHQLKNIETVPTQLSDLRASISQEVGLSLPDSLHLSVTDSTVTVKINVEPRKQKTFSDIAITPPGALNLNDYDLIPSHLTLVLGFPQSKYDSLTAANVAISFTRPPSLRDSTRVAIRYILPGFAEILGAHPDSLLIVHKP